MCNTIFLLKLNNTSERWKFSCDGILTLLNFSFYDSLLTIHSFCLKFKTITKSWCLIFFDECYLGNDIDDVIITALTTVSIRLSQICLFETRLHYFWIISIFSKLRIPFVLSFIAFLQRNTSKRFVFDIKWLSRLL